jgi:hypothetical protein
MQAACAHSCLSYISDIRERQTRHGKTMTRVTVSEHTCDRKGLPAQVIDESGDEPITHIYPTCSVCGKPQVFEKDWSRVRSDRNKEIQ